MASISRTLQRVREGRKRNEAGNAKPSVPDAKMEGKVKARDGSKAHGPTQRLSRRNGPT